jgi:hypothetical protein
VFSLIGTGRLLLISVAAAFKEMPRLDASRDRFLVTEGRSASADDEIALTGDPCSQRCSSSQSVEVPSATNNREKSR